MEGYRVEPLSGMRQTIARRMVESKQQAPHFYVTMDIDMAAAMALRAQLNAPAARGREDLGQRPDHQGRGAGAAPVPEHQRCRSPADEIHVHDQVNIGIAVARENGLVTAVIRDCDKKPLAQIATGRA